MPAAYSAKTGKAYWYLFVPLHWLIFGGLITQIEKRAASMSACPTRS
jgi:hypothetical protein